MFTESDFEFDYRDSKDAGWKQYFMMLFDNWLENNPELDEIYSADNEAQLVSQFETECGDMIQEEFVEYLDRNQYEYE